VERNVGLALHKVKINGAQHGRKCTASADRVGRVTDACLDDDLSNQNMVYNPVAGFESCRSTLHGDAP
jgi:hypothetical protein